MITFKKLLKKHNINISVPTILENYELDEYPEYHIEESDGDKLIVFTGISNEYGSKIEAIYNITQKKKF